MATPNYHAFASDNGSGICPEAWAALEEANTGYTPAYGEDEYTRAASDALRDFFEARGGPTEPFYFYDPYETNPKFSWDPTGAATTGRYTVRFDGEWSQTVGPGRSDVSIELIELA